MGVIWGRRKAEYFSRQDWTTQIRLNCLNKSLFARSDFSGVGVRSRHAIGDEIELICLSRLGKISWLAGQDRLGSVN